MTASDRVRARLKEWADSAGHGSQRKLAQAVRDAVGEPHSDQWISDIINGRSDLTLRDLDQVADHLDVPPGWLVRKHDRNYQELTMGETKVVEFFRILPDTVRSACLLMLDYLSRTRLIHGTARASRRPSSGDASHVAVVAPVAVSREEWTRTVNQLITDTITSLERLQSLAESEIAHPARQIGTGTAPVAPPRRTPHRKASHWGRRKS